jgi:hypothetical protein
MEVKIHIVIGLVMTHYCIQVSGSGRFGRIYYLHPSEDEGLIPFRNDTHNLPYMYTYLLFINDLLNYGV